MLGGLAITTHTLRPLSCPVFADGGRLSGQFRSHHSTHLDPLLVRPSPLWLLSQHLPSRVSPFQYEMACTVAVDGAPRFLSVFRSRQGSWTLYFRSLDSSLVGLRPFSLRMFHPNLRCVVFLVAPCCLLWYWLGFYLKWQHSTTVSQKSFNKFRDDTHNMLNARKQGVEVCIRSNGANKGASSSLPVPDMVSFESPALQRNHRLQKSESGPRIGTKIGPRVGAKIGDQNWTQIGKSPETRVSVKEMTKPTKHDWKIMQEQHQPSFQLLLDYQNYL